MKNTKLSKIAGLILAVALVTVALCVIPAFAESTVSAEIDRANIAYNEKTHVAMTVKITGTLAEGEEIGLAFWDDSVTGALTAENAVYVTFETTTKNGVKYYKSQGFNSIEMTKIFKVAPVLKSGESTEIIGKVLEYSVIKYAVGRLGDDNVTDKQLSLYYDLILYGSSAEEVLGDKSSDVALVYTVGGTVGNSAKAIYTENAATLETGYIAARSLCMGGELGEKVLLRAESVNPEGKYFLRWEDAEGNVVSNERLAYVDVVGGGLQRYFAIYGAKSQSLYYSAINLEGEKNGAIIDYSKITSTNSSNEYYTYNYEIHVGGMNVKPNTAVPYLKGEDGAPAAPDSTQLACIDIVDTMAGDKELRLYKDHVKMGHTVAFTSNVTGATAFELDFTYEELIKMGTYYGISFNVKDASGKATLTIRSNLAFNANSFSFSSNNAKVFFNSANGEGTNSHAFKLGETYTVKIVLGTYTEGDALKGKLDFYVNGEHFATARYDDYYRNGEGVDLSALDPSTTYITSASFLTTMAEDAVWRLDNVAFFK